MKPSRIIILVILAVFVVALGINFSETASIYTDFATAEKSGKEVHIVGSWVNREQSEYDSEKDMFTFFMQDTLNQVAKVLYYDPKPINFEQAEKVVVIGAYKNEAFVADKIVMKCPSKYEPTDITSGEKQGN
ncbi:MAG: cytochrome c maturation protein CcmE [Bacteroidia bacterium]|nr:cytochrome c maturation protein CcmE [Bacteroidia bacterium]